MPPQGAFYMLFDMSRFGLRSLELAQRLVDKAGVAFTPGIAFGDGMDGYLRMCFATSQENIDLAIDSLLALQEA
jgi:aspartate/methionine/tyrosine aminotransferase